MKKWKKYKLGDLITLQRGHDLTKAENMEGKYPIAGSNGIIGFHNSFTTKSPGITIGRSGNIGNPYFYEMDFWAHNTTLYVKEFKNSDPRFIYYLLKNINFGSHNSGSAVPSLNRNYVHPIEVLAPENIQDQKSIASILSSLDNKIELNLQMNQTLEAMAQAIFKEWFVNFNFPGFDGKLKDGLPKGWKKGKLKDVCEIKYGKDHKHLNDGNIPVYGSGGIMRFADQPLYSKHSILIPRKGTLSNLFYVSKPFWSVDTMFYTIIKSESLRKYLFYLLKTLNLASRNVGSAVPSLTTDVLNKIEITIPDDKILKQFESIISDYHFKMNENNNQIETLTQLRDSLLPKLMSGEIEV